MGRTTTRTPSCVSTHERSRFLSLARRDRDALTTFVHRCSRRARRSAALDNRPMHRSLRYRRGPATSGAASLPARCDGLKRSAHSRCMRGCSSVGRALQSHCRGQGFDSPQLHSNGTHVARARHGFRHRECCPPPLGRTESSNDGARGKSRRLKTGQVGRRKRCEPIGFAALFRFATRRLHQRRDEVARATRSAPRTRSGSPRLRRDPAKSLIAEFPRPPSQRTIALS